MWLFSRSLPFYVADLVDFDVGETWKCLALLLRIVSVVLSPCIASDQLDSLRLDINFYLQLFKKCFKDANIIPKQHYLVHIPSNIENFETPVGYWAMRFEAKHSYFKKVAKNSSFKNLANFLPKDISGNLL